MCTFMYLFVEHFSFAPVMSASIYHYRNYFDIRVLMMVPETETFTSTSHHNKFTYLDYVVFSATYIYIYIYIYILWSTNDKQEFFFNMFQYITWPFQQSVGKGMFVIMLLLGITHIFPHNKLVNQTYIAVATNTRAD